MNNQASLLETELKLHGDKLTEKINALEGDIINEVEFLGSKRRSFKEDVKERLGVSNGLCEHASSVLIFASTSS